jgi:imidazolonepropionase-like amidohydrolase
MSGHRPMFLALTLLAASSCSSEPDNNPSSGASGSSGNSSSSATSSGSSSGSGSSSASGGPCVSEEKAIKLGRLVSPHDGSVIEGAIVIAQGERISYVGADQAQIPCGAEVVDWSAFTGLPGLVDSHTHFAYQSDGAADMTPWQRAFWLHNNAPLVLMDLARKAALKTIKTGVTTAIDKGAGPYNYIVRGLRQEIAAGQTPGPRLFIANQGVSFQNLSIEMIQARIQQDVLGGADLIKVWADSCSDATLTCTPNFSFKELKAAVDEAHALGKPIAIHAYHADTAQLALMAGPDMIEHPEGLGASDFNEMIVMGTTYVPTIDHNRYYKDNYVWFKYPDTLPAQLDAFIQLNVKTLSEAHAAGVTIAMGSDAVFTGFGENTRELTWLVQGGMSPVEALAAATINGAASIGVDHEIGKVAVGYYADIIAVEGDPLTDINAVINGVRGVMKGGQLMALE